MKIVSWVFGLIFWAFVSFPAAFYISQRIIIFVPWASLHIVFLLILIALSFVFTKVLIIDEYWPRKPIPG